MTARRAWDAGFVLGAGYGFLGLISPIVAMLLLGASGSLIFWKGPRRSAITGLIAGFGLCTVILLAPMMLPLVVVASLGWAFLAARRRTMTAS
jgi:hypothetical protein